jgi:regulator of replication initiation timing
MSVEDKLKELEQRVGTMEAQGASESDQNLLSQYQSQILPKLMLIREKMIAEGGDIDQIRNERDQAINENVTLRKEIERLNYRVNHLIKSLNEEEIKNSKTA